MRHCSFTFVFGFVVSFWFPAFVYFRFVYVVPAFYLVISRGAVAIKSKRLSGILVGLLILINFTGWFIYVFDESQQREQWRQAANFVENRVTDDDVIIFEYPKPFSPYRWYSKKPTQVHGVTNSISADLVKTAEITQQTVKGKSGVY